MRSLKIKTALLLLLTLFLVSSCGGVQYVPRNVYNSPDLDVRLVAEKDASGGIAQKNFDHPQHMEQKTLKGLLASVQYKKGIAVFNDKPSNAFPPNVLKRLVPELQKAFATATPNEYIEFSFDFSRYKSVFKKAFFTDGFLFYENGELNCAFRNIAFDKSLENLKSVYAATEDSSYEPFTGNPTKTPPRKSWRIVPGPGQYLAQLDNTGLLGKKQYTNWVKIKPDEAGGAFSGRKKKVDGSMAASGKEETEQAGEQAVKPVEKEGIRHPDPAQKAGAGTGEKENVKRQTVEQNLKFLDELYREGLISKMAYKEKRRHLLELLQKLQ